MSTRLHRPRSPRRQRGATLVVSLIMLVLITLLALSSFTVGKSNLQIVGNMQQRTQALAAAESSVSALISSNQFTATPADALHNDCGGLTPCVSGNTTIDCNGVPNSVCVDSNGDGVTDVNVALAAACDSIQPIPVTALDFTNPNDAGCTIQYQQVSGIVGAANGNSLCSNSVWEVTASATDAVSGANYVVDQGVAVRVGNNAVCP